MIVRAILAVLGFLVLTTAGAQAQTNLVTNPGFESGATGWTTGGSGWTFGNATSSAPRSGTVHAFSRCGNASQTCTLSQAITITPGRYTFSVYAISPVSNASATSNFTATVGGQTLYNGTFQQVTGLNTDQTGYQFISGTFTLNANSTTISFSGFNSQGDLAIDDVSLVRVGNVPEPATWALMILGFGMVGATLRRRRGMPATGAVLVTA